MLDRGGRNEEEEREEKRKQREERKGRERNRSRRRRRRRMMRRGMGEEVFWVARFCSLLSPPPADLPLVVGQMPES